MHKLKIIESDFQVFVPRFCKNRIKFQKGECDLNSFGKYLSKIIVILLSKIAKIIIFILTLYIRKNLPCINFGKKELVICWRDEHRKNEQHLRQSTVRYMKNDERNEF